MKKFMQEELQRLEYHFNIHDRRQAAPPITVWVAFSIFIAAAIFMNAPALS